MSLLTQRIDMLKVEHFDTGLFQFSFDFGSPNIRQNAMGLKPFQLLLIPDVASRISCLAKA